MLFILLKITFSIDQSFCALHEVTNKIAFVQASSLKIIQELSFNNVLVNTDLEFLILPFHLIF